jgi:hypothetical protein
MEKSKRSEILFSKFAAAIAGIVLALIFTAGCQVTKTDPKTEMLSEKSAKMDAVRNKKNRAPVPKENIESAVNEMTAGFAKAKMAAESGNAPSINWPASSFPSGYPAYPDGEIVSSDSFFGDDLMIVIAQTSKASYESHIKALENSGWLFMDPEEGIDMAYKSSWLLTLLYEDEYACIYITDMGFDLEDLYTEAEWPENMPVNIPIYPDGDVGFVDEDEDYVFMIIYDTSKAAFESYKKELAGEGWVLGESDYLILKTEAGEWYLSLNFDESDNSVSFGLFFMENYDFED